MFAESLLKGFDTLQILMCLIVLGTMLSRRVARDFSALTVLVALDAVTSSLTVTLLWYRSALHIPIGPAYSVYFYSVWVSDFAEFILQALIIYNLFTNAMRPFPGLQKVGGIIFRWVGAVSLAVSLALAAGPQLFSKAISATQVVTEVAARLQQGIGVLVLCLLIFVCFAIRPLGLTFRSHIFGVVLGLAVMSTLELVQAAWFATVGAHSLYSPVYLISAAGMCVSLGIWVTYFALPEPARRMILLPTTSPFFLWNRISEVLGDAPGHVAIAGFSPSMLAPAEIEMLTAATAHEAAAEREREETAQLLLNTPVEALFPELPNTPQPAYALQ